MTSTMSCAFRHVFLKRLASTSPCGPYALLSSSLRHYSSDKKDNSAPPSSNDRQDPPDTSSPRNKLLDVTEYYSQYIKEYEQGGFKDEETVQWELRREKLNITRGRGETDVIDLDELVEFLRAEKVFDICTMRMPKMAYAPFMVLGTPLSRRHMIALTDKIRKAYKLKRTADDPPSLRIQDRTNNEWRVFDVGNAVVHLMMPSTRKKYDIEMLWAVGPELDNLTNSTSDLDEYSDRLRKLQEEVDSLSNVENEQTTLETEAQGKRA